MSHIFPRHCNAMLPTATAADGVYLIDQTGKRYFDGSGGAAISCLGHSDAKVTAAIKAQLDHFAFAHTRFLTSQAAENLADKLIEHAPGDLDRVYIVSGGSEAVEAAIKLARQYHLERGEPDRQRIIARNHSYHGNTLATLATGGNQARRAPFAPLMIETSHISACYEYRDRRENESAYDYGQRVANELETEILRLGPETVMAFVAETVVGATLGAVAPVDGYFTRIREICDQYGVLLILDEVMCGMGRTGKLFACEHYGIAPDIMTIAKGLGAGYQPIGAMLSSKQIYDTIAAGSGFFQHGHSYVGHPTACAAGVAVLERLVDDGLVARSAEMGKRLKTALIDAFGQHSHIGDIRGIGLFIGLEFVENRATKAPFDASLGVNKALTRACFEAGLICYPMGGGVDGINGDHILLAPPFILSDAHIYEIIDKLGVAFEQVFQS